MEYNEFILIGIGTAISVLGYFLKRENKRLEGVELLVNQINVTLAKNEVRDSERNGSIEKRLEDRRVDVRKLYDLVQKN
jgi:pyrimidine operon attenuation protein/uracil phosphoribosyltransferase